jgi:hypothetical protein
MRFKNLRGRRVTSSPLSQLKKAEKSLVDVSAYEGYVQKLDKIFEIEYSEYIEDMFEIIEPQSPSFIIKPNTYRKLNKDWRWKNPPKITVKQEQKFFEELMADIAQINVDDIVISYRHMASTSEILRKHLDFTSELNSQLEELRRELYIRAQKLQNDKFRIIATNKINNLWGPQ